MNEKTQLRLFICLLVVVAVFFTFGVDARSPRGTLNNEWDPSALHNVNNLSDLTSAPTARTNLSISNHNLITVDSAGNASVPGILHVNYDTDGSTVIGRAVISNAWGANTAAFSHIDHAAITNAALQQFSDGSTKLNAASGRTVTFEINDVTAAQINSSLELLVATSTDAGAYWLQVGGDSYISGSLTVDGNVDGVDVAGHVASTGTDVHGLGTAATKNTGTSGDAVGLLNTANTMSADQTIDDGGSNTNSYKLKFESNNGGTIQYSSILGVYGADPYLRLSCASATDGTERGVLDLHSTKIAPVYDAFTDLGGSSNKFKDGYFSGSLTVDGNVDGVDVAAASASVDAHHADSTDPHGTLLTQTNASITTNLTVANRLGVATTTPQTGLDVNSSLSVRGISSPSAGSSLELAFSSGVGYVWSYNRGTSTYLPTTFRGNPLILNDTGGFYIGIGTTTPATALHVVGGVSTLAGASMTDNIYLNGVSVFGGGTDGANNKISYYAGGDAANISRGAYMTIAGNEGTTSPFGSGSVCIVTGNNTAAEFGIYTGAGSSKRLSVGYTGHVTLASGVLSLTPRAAPPEDGAEGMIYADTDHHLYYHNGTTWLQLDNAP